MQLLTNSATSTRGVEPRAIMNNYKEEMMMVL